MNGKLSEEEIGYLAGLLDADGREKIDSSTIR